MFKYALIFMSTFLTLCLSMALPAFATEAAIATVETTATTLNLGESIQMIVSFVFVAIGSFVAWGVGRALNLFEEKTGVQIDDSTRAYLNTAINAGISWARAKTAEKATSVSTVELENEVVARTAQYVVDMVPDAVAYFGLTEEKLKTLIETRLASSTTKS